MFLMMYDDNEFPKIYLLPVENKFRKIILFFVKIIISRYLRLESFLPSTRDN